MDAIQLNLPPALQSFVKQRAAEGSFSDANEYVLALIQADQIERARVERIISDPANRQRIRELLAEGMVGPVEDLDMDAIRREVRESLSPANDE